MKTIKTTFLLALILCFTVNVSQAQKFFQIHQDNVKPSKMMEYEKIAKEFNEASIEHNVQTSWVTAMSSDFRYFYITPLENFADLDKRPFADMAKAMGDNFGDMFDRFDKCYDSHGSYILALDEKLSYVPEGSEMHPTDENYRKWIYMYYTPENGDKVREGMKAVKELFASKGSKEGYRIYRNGFGSMESFYLVSISAKDEVDSAQRKKVNEELLGPDRWETFNKVLNHISRMEEYSGEMRPDLSYAPKKE